MAGWEIQKYFDQNFDAANRPVIELEGKNQLIVVNHFSDPEPKTLAEAKGLITADYQAFLEEQWINGLREKYKVEINQEVYKTIKP